ncbi:unnamed protein product [Amoebophrya sp. A120]|nr:unnamed protein product [Amoebophrya sp. A120]|eukprot:GSA120T00026006001.1
MADEKKTDDRLKPPRPTLKVFRESGGAVERGFQVPGAFNVTVLAEKEKPDRSKPHTDRIFEMLKDMNERDNYFLGEPRSAFVKTRTDYDPARTHLTEQMPVLEKHRAIVAEEGEAHKTCQNPVLNTMDKARAEQMTLNTLSTFELSPTSYESAQQVRVRPLPLIVIDLYCMNSNTSVRVGKNTGFA